MSSLDAIKTAEQETRADLQGAEVVAAVDPRDVARLEEQRRYVPGTGWQSKVPRYASIVLYVISALSIITALVPWLRRRDDWLRTFSEIIALPVIPYLTWGVLLWILAGALYRRKRAAYRTLLFIKWVQVIVLGILLVLWFVVRDDDTFQEFDFPWESVVAMLFSIAWIVVLMSSRHEFYAIVQRRSSRQALLALVVGTALTIGLTLLMVTLVPGTLPAESRFEWAVREFLAPVGFESPDPLGRPPRFIIFVTGVLGAITLIVTAYYLFRPQRKGLMMTPEEEVKIRSMLRASVATLRTRLGVR